MTSKCALWLVVLGGTVAGCQGRPPQPSLSAHRDYVVVPGGTNALQLRLYTNASPDAARLLNTFELDGYGERLLQSLGGEQAQRSRATVATNAAFHQILINGRGPLLARTNNMTVVEEASGPEWHYFAFDVSAAYSDRLEQYRRAILFVQPDLFVFYDKIVAKAPATFQMLLHPPAATRVDDIWHDLRLELTNASLQIHAPGGKGMLRSWQRLVSPADGLLPGTATMELGPTNKVTQLDLITVLAVHRGGEKRDYAFKLLESNTSVGARIHRDGLPTLIAFRTDPAIPAATLTGFGFTGPVGVDVFRPKRR